MVSLIDYLKTLDPRRVPGVTDTVLHFATIITPRTGSRPEAMSWQLLPSPGDTPRRATSVGNLPKAPSRPIRRFPRHAIVSH